MFKYFGNKRKIVLRKKKYFGNKRQIELRKKRKKGLWNKRKIEL